MILFLQDPVMMEDFLIHKAKYVDKENSAHELFYPLLGDATLFLKTNKDWEEKRKGLSIAFFKTKLLLMVGKIKARVI